MGTIYVTKCEYTGTISRHHYYLIKGDLGQKFQHINHVRLDHHKQLGISCLHGLLMFMVNTMKSISFFNNKGGVGKTTLTCNISYSLASDHNKKILVIDCDPQCNTTILVLGEDRAVDIYDKNPNKIDTILTVLEPIEFGDSSLNLNVTPISKNENRFMFDLIPGHPRISIIEERLSQAWRDSAAGEIEGLRRTTWANTLCNHFKDDYDFIIFDLGPSLGSLNRTCLVASNHFVAPMGADIFSIIGLKNIGDWFDTWILDYSNAISNCEKKYKGAINKYGIPKKLSIESGFLGYTIQAYIAKYTGGERRPTKAFENITKDFPIKVKESLGRYTKKGTKMNLGEIPNMFSLIPLAQAVNAPIGALVSADGLVGSHYSQSKKYHTILKQITARILSNIGE